MLVILGFERAILIVGHTPLWAVLTSCFLQLEILVSKNESIPDQRDTMRKESDDTINI